MSVLIVTFLLLWTTESVESVCIKIQCGAKRFESETQMATLIITYPFVLVSIKWYVSKFDEVSITNHPDIEVLLTLFDIMKLMEEDELYTLIKHLFDGENIILTQE